MVEGSSSGLLERSVGEGVLRVVPGGVGTVMVSLREFSETALVLRDELNY